MPPQPQLFSSPGAPLAHTTSFISNMRLPVHRWFRYSAGFSAQWVESLIAEATNVRVLDPFAGSGTTLLAAQSAGHASIGLDPHPLVSRVALAKLRWNEDPAEFLAVAADVIAAAKPSMPFESVPKLLTKCYPDEKLSELLGLREAVNNCSASEPLRQLVWLAFVSIIRPTSPAGTAQWQYVLPSKSKAKSLSVRDAWRIQTDLMAADMRSRQEEIPSAPPADFKVQDARDIGDAVPPGWATHVICSPPYANNYDYGDATRLEQTVLGEVLGWSDLKSTRTDLIRSCSQHMVGYDAEAALETRDLAPIRERLEPIYRDLAAIRLDRGGRKAYHSMVVAYFHDMARMWESLRMATAQGASVCFVIGDSAPYGVHVPVDDLLADQAEAAGFRFQRFDKMRDRNVKWKNRKHRVPLHEGNLWLEG